LKPGKNASAHTIKSYHDGGIDHQLLPC